jgi:AmmeMemoRadiSam system protein A
MLRGCIGHIIPQGPLYECVQQNAVNACAKDIRFDPVGEHELDDIEVEVSVLSALKQVRYDDAEDLASKIRPGVDGVVVKKGWKQSTYLPQVWSMYSDTYQFLRSLCEKGGMPSDCYRDAEVYTYQATVFDESLLNVSAE